MQQFLSDAEIHDLVRRFEACELGLAEFTHARHLAVGMAYLTDVGFEDALARMRTALRRFSAHHGKMGYHETITRFWLLQLEALRLATPGRALWERCQLTARSFGDSGLLFEYYDRERVLSPAARAKWMEPDKRQILVPVAAVEM